jgi:hypothetical protein
MKSIMILLGISILGTSCLSQENIEISDEIVATEEQLVSDGFWLCSQQCSNGTTLYGYGSTSDGAYQDLSGCGAGGGSINCGYIDQTPIITEAQIIPEDEE